jgi:hypothetical protein
MAVIRCSPGQSVLISFRISPIVAGIHYRAVFEGPEDNFGDATVIETIEGDLGPGAQLPAGTVALTAPIPQDARPGSYYLQFIEQRAGSRVRKVEAANIPSAPELDVQAPPTFDFPEIFFSE